MCAELLSSVSKQIFKLDLASTKNRRQQKLDTIELFAIYATNPLRHYQRRKIDKNSINKHKNQTTKF